MAYNDKELEMFDYLFENRNSTITNLIKLGDCLGRTLRENVELFSIDSEKAQVAYLTESGKIISGEYDLDENVTLNDIKVRKSDVFTDNKVFDSYVNEKVSSFVGKLNSNKYSNADENFTDILSLWEARLKFENVKKKLGEKTVTFSEAQNIINTEEFQRFLEVMPQFISFLTEEKEKIQQVQEIENAIKLSNSVSKAFNFPKLSYETLEENKSYTISRGLNKSIYELICKQELVKKELLESKKNFEDVWATNSSIRSLAALVFEESEEDVLEALVEAVLDVPYLSLATKKQLFESINNAFSLTDDNTISEKELKLFSSRLFEMKKPIKKVVIDLLNEKYGINIQSLKECPTFAELASTQVVIFEALTRLAPKGSVVKDSLSDISILLKEKNGVEVIDVNDLLQECFNSCDYSTFCEDFSLVETISFDKILDGEATTAELLEKAKERLLFDAEKHAKKEKENLSPEQEKGRKRAEKEEDHPDSDTHDEDDSEKLAKSKKSKKDNKDNKDNDEIKEEGVAPEVAAQQGEPAPEAEAPSPEEEAPESDEPTEKPLTKDEFIDTLTDMEELYRDLSPEEEEVEQDVAGEDEEVA